MSQRTAAETPEWLRRIVARMEAVENLQPEPYWMSGEFPPWVQHIARELAKTLFSVAKLSPDRAWHPGEVGAILGHQFAYWHYFFERMEAGARGPEPSPDDLQKVFGPGVEERAIKHAELLFGKILPAFDKALKFAFCIATDQDYDSASSFFAAYGRAVLRKPANAGDIGRTNSTIYLVMLMSWRRVEELGSIPELHRRLCRCAYLGSRVVGDIKRVEKMCARIGLSYPAIAASKRRAENPDMNA